MIASAFIFYDLLGNPGGGGGGLVGFLSLGNFIFLISFLRLLNPGGGGGFWIRPFLMGAGGGGGTA